MNEKILSRIGVITFGARGNFLELALLFLKKPLKSFVSHSFSQKLLCGKESPFLGSKPV